MKFRERAGGCPEPLVLSHRGRVRLAAGGDADNTESALAAAFAAGADGAEVDVRGSACGSAVLVHDRLVPDGRAVGDLDLEALEAALGHPVATLAAVLERWPDRVWNVELKDAAGVAPAVEALRTSAARRILVTSFVHGLARDVGRSARVPFGYLIGHQPVDVGGLLQRSRDEGAEAIVLHGEHVAGGVLKAASDAGLMTWVYGLLTVDEHVRAAAFGIDALITDELEAALAAAR